MHRLGEDQQKALPENIKNELQFEQMKWNIPAAVKFAFISYFIKNAFLKIEFPFQRNIYMNYCLTLNFPTKAKV